MQTYNIQYNDTKENQKKKKKKECNKSNSHIISKLHMIYTFSNNDKHPVTKTFTLLHYTCQDFTSSHLNLT